MDHRGVRAAGGGVGSAGRGVWTAGGGVWSAGSGVGSARGRVGRGQGSVGAGPAAVPAAADRDEQGQGMVKTHGGGVYRPGRAGGPTDLAWRVTC